MGPAPTLQLLFSAGSFSHNQAMVHEANQSFTEFSWLMSLLS
ncbi:hypothetical protein SynBIOSE41_03778 [Synechococcus sp. BIOS-E4-1]|nr:hypothetical protein SynBIOSE41_03778 [Synechococcus sp. BIOS-E4-1]